MLAFITLFSMLSGESTVQFELLKYYSKPTVIIVMYTITYYWRTWSHYKDPVNFRIVHWVSQTELGKPGK